jgi:hypothetical protein
MSRAQLQILWCGILAVVAAVVFPPYGYDHVLSISSYAPRENQWMDGARASRDVRKSIGSWRYLGHSFILASAFTDHGKDKLNKMLAEKAQKAADPSIANAILSAISTPTVSIGWHIIFAEIVVISLLTGGGFITTRRYPQPPTAEALRVSWLLLL